MDQSAQGLADPSHPVTRAVDSQGVPISKLEPDWDPVYKQDLHGVFLVTGESEHSVQDRIADITHALKDSVDLLANELGHVRPKEGPDGQKLRGKEHFGWQDGISQPIINGFHVAPENSKEVLTDLGVIVIRSKGGGPSKEPEWAHNGSYLVFRKLHQRGMLGLS